MAEAIAVLNAGSSSLKVSLFALDGAAVDFVAKGQVEGLSSRARDERSAARHLFAFLHDHAAGRDVVAVGHRVVHGGASFVHPVRVDERVLRALEALVPLAPLHQPHNLAPIRALAVDAPDLLQVACFDTAFHRTQPQVASRIALPSRFADAGIQRYGFHGLSYESIANAFPAVDPQAASGRTIVAHLGNGASMCAMRNGTSIASTMGFTALDGLVMGTRPGLVDPGVILHLLDAHRMDVREVERLLYHESGLLGVSGVSSDMRTLIASDDPNAALAVDLFCYRAAREIGSLAAALGGLDALVFTGGIGEHAAPVRAAIVKASAWLGLELDEAANNAGQMRITTRASHIPVYVIPTNEELVIAQHTARLIDRRKA